MIVMRFALITLLYSCSVIVLNAQNLGFSLPEGKRRIQIPFEIHNNLIVVPVVLNHALPLKFIVDTGVRTARVPGGDVRPARTGGSRITRGRAGRVVRDGRHSPFSGGTDAAVLHGPGGHPW